MRFRAGNTQQSEIDVKKTGEIVPRSFWILRNRILRSMPAEE